MERESLWALVLAAAVAACTSVSAEYPSWEPTADSVPVVRDRKLALADLEVSRKLWWDRGWKDYSYVRARQTSHDEVEFTLVVVRNDRVTERSLLTSKTDANGLGDRLSGKLGQAPKQQWSEGEREIGRHAAGAPALMLDELYDLCRDRVLSLRSEHLPRLSFHHDGLLQHCGFLNDDCDDCAAASLQTVAHVTPKPWQVPHDLLCTDRYGLFLHDQEPLTSFGCEMCSCRANALSDPRRDREREGLADICKIDPAACPRAELSPSRATWICKYLLTGDGCGGGVVRHLTPECLALPRPTSWSDPAWQRRCQPRP
jgi:hypothetical protein